MVKRRLLSSFVIVNFVAILFGITQSGDTFAMSDDGTRAYQEIEWVALMPEGDLSALLNRPEFLDDIADGSNEDSVEQFASKTLEDERAQQYQSALTSTRVIKEFDGKAIRIPGFIVPLEQNDEQQVTTFFVVPYFGACLHMPPPPPNQILFVEYKEGIALENLYDAYWFEGTIVIEEHESTLGTSAYSLILNNVALYEE